MNPAPATAAAGVSPLEAVQLLRSAGAALLTQAALHAELARVEWEEEKRRLLKMLVMTLLGFACLLCSMLFAGALVLAAAWETAHRLPVIAVLMLAYTVGVVMAWGRFQACAAMGREAFTASREELAADAALLKSHL